MEEQTSLHHVPIGRERTDVDKRGEPSQKRQKTDCSIEIQERIESMLEDFPSDAFDHLV